MLLYCACPIGKDTRRGARGPTVCFQAGHPTPMPGFPWNLSRDRPHLSGDDPVPWPGSLPGLGFWPERFRRLNVKGGQRPFPKETRSALDIEGKHVTIQGPSPDLTFVSGLLGDLAHLLRAWLRCPRRCPGVAVTTLGRPSHRARSGHAHPSSRRVSNARVGVFPRRDRRRCRRSSPG